MTSAFISYAHEDQEFVLALVERLGAHGLDVRYDQVVLHVGDSLLRTLSREIADGDFLIAIVSPDSMDSEWCQREVAIAATQGIEERRVKVLPIRLRGAQMPAMLMDTYWADADRDGVETVSRRLAASMNANLAEHEEEADQAAEEVEAAEEVSARDDVAAAKISAQLDDVADAVWDVFAEWERMYRGGNLADLRDRQRRLKWSLDRLPHDVRPGLALVEQFSEAGWDDFLGVTDRVTAEQDLREEMRSVRAQLVQGLPVSRRWTLDADLGEVGAGHRDASCFLWQIRRGEETKRIEVYISGTAMAIANEHLPLEVGEAKDTHGRSVVMTLLALDDPPKQVLASTAGIALTLPD